MAGIPSVLVQRLAAGHRWLGMALGGLLYVLLSGVFAPAAADVSCDASVNRTTVPNGGEVILTVTVRGDINWSPDFQMPDLPDVRVYAGGTNQSMSMINGATETSVSRTFYLKVNRTSDFTIGPVTITSPKGDCVTDPIPIKVTAAQAQPQQIPPANSGNRTSRPIAPPTGSGAGGKPGDEVFVTMEADHNEAWVGQQIVITFRYWRRVQPWNNPSYTPPRTEGFWRENLGSEKSTRQVVQGRAYNVTEIRYAIFPTRVGDLVVGAAELSFPRGAFDSFFQTRRNRRRPNTLRTDPLTIHVKDLPQPRPAGFSGIVASSLKLISQVDQDSIPRGEALGLRVLLDADGFLKGFSDLKVPAPENVRLHDAGENFRTGAENDRLIGHLKIEKVIVPEQDGLLQLPPVELVWFDTSAGRFRTARTEAWQIHVTPSDLPPLGSDDSGFLRSELSRLGDDLAFIKPVPASLSQRRGPLTGRPFWWILLLLPAALLGGFRVFLGRLDAARRDPAGRRRRRALAAAKALLVADSDEPLGNISRAICGFVADCTNRPPASVGPTEIAAFCGSLDEVDNGERLVEILGTCDAGRYGGAAGESVAEMRSQVTELLEVLARQCSLGGSERDGGDRAKTGRVQALLLAVICCGAVSAGGPARGATSTVETTGTDPLRLVAEGNQAYTAGDLDRAMADYRAASDLGVNDAVLHFNMGNTFARTGHLGQAVASYLRAQRLAPGDRDIRKNLSWVRRHIRDLELSQNSWPLFIAQLAGLVGLLTLDQWGGILIVLVWSLSGLIAWGWYREEFSIPLRRVLLGLIAALVLVSAVTGGRWYVEVIRETGVITEPEVVVRSGPAETFSALFEVHDGLTLNVEEQREDWVRVGLGGAWDGWVPRKAVALVRQSAAPQGR